ncbi:MAG TPA: hypothetical protein VL360_01160 [Gammaproteobacteria bacterium]|jgi:hypothetical protein|nr:hypothetical protein [Gammaproteobacteria bacterium]
MKIIISLVLSFLIAFTAMVPIDASAYMVYACGHKHYKKHKHHTYTKKRCGSHYTSGFYSPGYCQEYASACGSDQVCYSGHYYRCKTVFYWHSGRNTSRVEVCR